MERAKVVKDEIVEKDTHLLAVYLETKNSCLILLSEREDKLGTLAIAVPRPKEMLGPLTSSILLGDSHAISARMFAEYVAAKKGKMALVSIYLETMDEMQAQSFFKRLIERVVQATESSEKQEARA
ncbi:MAG: hypothetical protein ABSC91_09455 [Candidatus Bathyarchaeia archaeon]|jgi:hypothetical protein